MYFPQNYNAFSSYAFGSAYSNMGYQTAQTQSANPQWSNTQACGGMQSGFGMQAGFWSQLMQIQQSMFQGWQSFCGCQERPQCGPPRDFGQNDHFGPPRGRRSDRFRNCFGGRPRTCAPRPRPTCASAPTPTPPSQPAPTPVTTPPAPAPSPAAPLTRSAAPAQPRTQVATSTPIVTMRTTQARPTQVAVAQNFGAFGGPGATGGAQMYQNSQFVNVGVVGSVLRY